MTAVELPGHEPAPLARREPARRRRGRQRSGYERRCARFACYGRLPERNGLRPSMPVSDSASDVPPPSASQLSASQLSASQRKAAAALLRKLTPAAAELG